MALAILFLCGCASVPRYENMVYAGDVSGKYNRMLLNSVRLASTTRGRQHNAAPEVEFSADAFDDALLESLKAQGLYSDTGRFLLQAHVLKIEQPPGDFDMQVTSHVNFALSDTATGRKLFEEMIVTESTVLTSEALASVKRRCLANERSARANIARFLDKLSRL